MTEQENTKLAKSFFDNLNAHALDKNDALTAVLRILIGDNCVPCASRPEGRLA